MAENSRRTVVLRDERTERDWRNLWAYVDEEGALHIDGQDLGPSTAVISSDGEYEWFATYAAEHVPEIIALLGGRNGEDVLDLLAREWSGPRSYSLEERLRKSNIPAERHS
jgi:hypothetical protein